MTKKKNRAIKNSCLMYDYKHNCATVVAQLRQNPSNSTWLMKVTLLNL